MYDLKDDTCAGSKGSDIKAEIKVNQPDRNT